MAKYRQGRLSEEIKKSISGFLINGAKDPALTSRIISITGVDVTRDGSYATVYISPVCLTDEDKEMVYSGVSSSTTGVMPVMAPVVPGRPVRVT